MSSAVNQHKPRVLRAQGFTFIELIVAIFILSILSTILIIAFTRNYHNEKLKRATRSSMNWLEDVRKLAIQKDTPCLISINNSNSTLKVEQVNDERFELCGNFQRSLLIKQLEKGMSDIQLCSGLLINHAATAAHPLKESNGDLVLSCNSGTTLLAVSPRGTSLGCNLNGQVYDCETYSTLLTLSSPKSNHSRCIVILAPTGQIRSGKLKGGSCDFSSAY